MHLFPAEQRFESHLAGTDIYLLDSFQERIRIDVIIDFINSIRHLRVMPPVERAIGIGMRFDDDIRIRIFLYRRPEHDPERVIRSHSIINRCISPNLIDNQDFFRPFSYINFVNRLMIVLRDFICHQRIDQPFRAFPLLVCQFFRRIQFHFELRRMISVIVCAHAVQQQRMRLFIFLFSIFADRQNAGNEPILNEQHAPVSFDCAHKQAHILIAVFQTDDACQIKIDVPCFVREHMNLSIEYDMKHIQNVIEAGKQSCILAIDKYALHVFCIDILGTGLAKFHSKKLQRQIL